jgi:hypothetical protein
MTEKPRSACWTSWRGTVGAGPVDLPEFVADALIATAHAARDESDRRALQAYRQAQVGADEILALVREAPLAADDLARIRAALDLRQAQDRATNEVVIDKLRGEAREMTSTTVAGAEGGNLAVRLGQGNVYYHWRDGRRKRTKYVGKVSAPLPRSA